MEIKEVKESIPNEEVIGDLSELFKVLGDPTRTRILFVLEKGDFCVSDISNAVNMTKYAVSHQLRTLKQAKLVKSRRDGKSIFYSLDDSHVRTILSMGMEHAMEQEV